MGIESFIRVIYYGKERLESTCGPFLPLLCDISRCLYQSPCSEDSPCGRASAVLSSVGHTDGRGGGMMRLALDASYGRAKFTDTAEEGPGNWVPPSPPIVHLGLLVPSSRESVSCRQSIRACSQVGEARGGGGGGWCVCCRGAPKDTQPASRQTAIMHAGKQVIKEGRGESSSAAQAWPIKIQHSFPSSNPS